MEKAAKEKQAIEAAGDGICENKEEKVNFSGSGLRKLDVSKGTDITELYVQDNCLDEIDLTNNRRIRILDCTGNPLKYIKGFAPGSGEFLGIEAARGGSVGLKYSPEDGQRYFAYPDEGYVFGGWYNALGDRLSKETAWSGEYGCGMEIVAMFIKR